MKFAIFAHFNQENRVMPHAWLYIESLVSNGFKVIFVSNSVIPENELAVLEENCINVIVRENIGLDFCMWKAGIESLSLQDVSQLLLTNSSIIGPLRPLSSVFASASDWDCDFWGLTDNIEIAHHLQSYFMVFRKNVIISDAFSAFWDSVLPYRSKDQIIMSYEVGLTIWLQERGFRWRPMFGQKDIYNSQLSQRKFLKKLYFIIFGNTGMGNTTLVFPEQLLEMGFPFIKAYLLNHGTPLVSKEKALSLIRAYANNTHIK